MPTNVLPTKSLFAYVASITTMWPSLAERSLLYHEHTCPRPIFYYHPSSIRFDDTNWIHSWIFCFYNLLLLIGWLNCTILMTAVFSLSYEFVLRDMEDGVQSFRLVVPGLLFISGVSVILWKRQKPSYSAKVFPQSSVLWAGVLLPPEQLTEPTLQRVQKAVKISDQIHRNVWLQLWEKNSANCL